MGNRSAQLKVLLHFPKSDLNPQAKAHPIKAMGVAACEILGTVSEGSLTMGLLQSPIRFKKVSIKEMWDWMEGNRSWNRRHLYCMVT